jgi:high-affinity iron transporter
LGAAFIITLREGLEIALIVAILLAYLNRIDRRDQHRAVWLGAGLAAAVSLISGAVIWIVARDLPTRSRDAFEGVATLIAAGVVTWMVFWMRRHASKLRGELQGKIDLVIGTGPSGALALVAFFVVIREGLETALFLFSAFEANSATPVLSFTGALLGLVGAVALGYLFYRGGIRLNLRIFFLVTGLLLILVVATLLRYALHELTDAGALSWLQGSFLLESAGTLGAVSNVFARAILGLKGDPTWLEVVVWTGYVVVVAGLFLRPTGPKVIPSDAVVPPQPAEEDAEAPPAR